MRFDRTNPLESPQLNPRVEVHHSEFHISWGDRIRRLLRVWFGPRINVHEGRKILQDSFVLHLRTLGFKGTRNTYWKRFSDQIGIVNIQPSQWNWPGPDYLFYINLGTSPFPSDPRRAHTMKEYQCSRQTRLGPTSGQDWVFTGHRESDIATLSLLNEHFTSRGLPWLVGKPEGNVLGNIYETTTVQEG